MEQFWANQVILSKLSNFEQIKQIELFKKKQFHLATTGF